MRRTTSNVPAPEDEKVPLTRAQKKALTKKVENEALLIIESSSDKFIKAIDEIKEALMNPQKENVPNADIDAKICERILLGLRKLNEDEKAEAEIRMLTVLRDIKKN